MVKLFFCILRHTNKTHISHHLIYNTQETVPTKFPNFHSTNGIHCPRDYLELHTVILINIFLNLRDMPDFLKHIFLSILMKGIIPQSVSKNQQPQDILLGNS